MRRIVLSLLILLILFVGIRSFADTEVGKIVEIDGSVSIDAFGAGKFIEAVEGDTLYDTTILRVGYESSAQIEVSEETKTIPAETEVELSAISASSERKRRRRWLPSIVGAVKDLLSSRSTEEDSVELGSRAAEVESDTTVWMLDEEDDEVLFEDARELIETGNYADALDKLNMILFVPEAALPGEIEYLKGHSLYHLELYQPAILMYEEAEIEAENSGIPSEFLPFRAALYFEWSASNYMLGNASDAVEIFERSGAEDSDLAPFAIIIYAASLSEIGRRGDAETVVEDALERFEDPEVVEAFRSLFD